MRRVLVVEDEEGLRRSLGRFFRKIGYEVAVAESREDAYEALEGLAPDLVVVDVGLPDGLGFGVVEEVRRQRIDARVIVMTGEVAIDHAVTALRSGADDFLAKPFSLEALQGSLDRVEQQATLTDPSSPAPVDDMLAWRDRVCPALVGEDPALLRVLEVIRRVAETDCSVLITGETGTGKELIAHALHDASDRASGQFVPVNCASIPDNLMESELFGHSKGSFTGATSNYKGRFQVADGGTLFLDEIGEMAPQLQAKMLRVLQEREVRPIGETRAQKVDVRVVAATHRDVDEMAAAGEFREDLLYRLDVIRIELPPLRARRSDIPRLVAHFISEVAHRRKRDVTGVDPEAMAALEAYSWPGNVRQLRHVVERMVVLAREPVLTFEDIPPRVRVSDHASPPGAPILPEDGVHLKDAVEQFENALILQALERTGWNKNQAAAILHMNRTTLVEKIKKKGIEPNPPDQLAS